jgi:hypothetical protein
MAVKFFSVRRYGRKISIHKRIDLRVTKILKEGQNRWHTTRGF